MDVKANIGFVEKTSYPRCYSFCFSTIQILSQERSNTVLCYGLLPLQHQNSGDELVCTNQSSLPNKNRGASTWQQRSDHVILSKASSCPNTHTHTYTNTHTLSHLHTLSLSLTRIHTLCHTHTHSLPLSLSLSICLSVSLSISLSLSHTHT